MQLTDVTSTVKTAGQAAIVKLSISSSGTTCQTPYFNFILPSTVQVQNVETVPGVPPLNPVIVRTFGANTTCQLHPLVGSICAPQDTKLYFIQPLAAAIESDTSPDLLSANVQFFVPESWSSSTMNVILDGGCANPFSEKTRRFLTFTIDTIDTSGIRVTLISYLLF